MGRCGFYWLSGFGQILGLDEAQMSLVGLVSLDRFYGLMCAKCIWWVKGLS